MSVCRAGAFIADVERQFEWYAVEAGWEVAERYLTAVEATCKLLGAYPFLGSTIGRFPISNLRIITPSSAIPMAIRSLWTSGPT